MAVVMTGVSALTLGVPGVTDRFLDRVAEPLLVTGLVCFGHVPNEFLGLRILIYLQLSDGNTASPKTGRQTAGDDSLRAFALCSVRTFMLR